MRWVPWALSRRRFDLLKNCLFVFLFIYFFYLFIYFFFFDSYLSQRRTDKTFFNSTLAEPGYIPATGLCPGGSTLIYSCHIGYAPASSDYSTKTDSTLGYRTPLKKTKKLINKNSRNILYTPVSHPPTSTAPPPPPPHTHTHIYTPLPPKQTNNK